MGKWWGIIFSGLLLCSCNHALNSAISTITDGGGGTDIGNGGNILVCNDGKNEAFDIYEAKAARRIDLDLGDVSEPVGEKVQRIINRVPKESGFRQILLNNFNEFQSYSIIDDIDLRKISDTDPDPKNIITKPGCHIEQAVVQKAPLTDTDYTYFVDIKKWNQIDNNSKAALILHEIIYRYMISQGATDSRSTRLVNAWIMAPQTQRPCWLHKILRDLKMDGGITQFVYNDALFNAKDTIWEDSCLVKEGNATPESGFKVLNRKVYPHLITPGSQQRWNVSFDDVGELKTIFYDHLLVLDYHHVHMKMGNTDAVEYLTMAEGDLIEASVQEGTFQVDGKLVTFKGIFNFTSSLIIIETENKVLDFVFDREKNEYKPYPPRPLH